MQSIPILSRCHCGSQEHRTYGLSSGFLHIDLRRALATRARAKIENFERGLVVSSFCKHFWLGLFSKSQTKPLSGSMSSSFLLSFRGLTKTSFHKKEPNSTFKYPHHLIMRCRCRRPRRRCCKSLRWSTPQSPPPPPLRI